MADQILFEVDASKILAKLHLAGIQACKYDMNTDFMVNTGIKNDNPKLKPDNPGKVEFDLTNASGEYEVGFVTQLEYSRENSDTRKWLDIVSRYDAAKSDKGLLDKDDEKSDDKKAPSKDQYDDAVKNLEAAGLKDLDPKAIEAQIDKAEKAAGAEEKDYEKQLSEATSLAFSNIKAYFDVFAGAKNNKLNSADDLVKINIGSKIKNSNDSNLILNYQIEQADDKEIELLKKQFEANPKKCVEKICFKVKYTLTVDK